MAKDKQENEVKGKAADSIKADVGVGFVEITPLKDFMLHAPPEVESLQLKAGVKVEVSARFIEGLKTEKVI